MTSAGAAVTESAIREWLRRRQLAYCPACIIAGLQTEVEDTSRVQAAVAALARATRFLARFLPVRGQGRALSEARGPTTNRPDAGWCHEPKTLAALACQTADYLRDLHGVGRRFGMDSPSRALGRRTWLHAYAECARFWFLPIEDAALISAVSDAEEAQPCQNLQAHSRIEQWWEDVTHEDAQHRHRATRLARTVAEALGPPADQSSSLDPRRVYSLYTDRRRLNRLYVGLVRRFQAPPPIS